MISRNPKDLLAASTKLDVSYWPTAATNIGVLKLMEGRFKYGQYNWRQRAVSLRTYLSAAKRHIDDLLERVDYDEHGIHSIGGVLASAAIIADAIATGCLIDDRALITYDVHAMHEELAKKQVELKEKFPKPVDEECVEPKPYTGGFLAPKQVAVDANVVLDQVGLQAPFEPWKVWPKGGGTGEHS